MPRSNRVEFCSTKLLSPSSFGGWTFRPANLHPPVSTGGLYPITKTVKPYQIPRPSPERRQPLLGHRPGPQVRIQYRIEAFGGDAPVLA